MKKVLVTGANGFLGGHLVKMLHEQGYAVSVIIRPAAALTRLGGVPCDIIYGNIDKEEDVLAAVAGKDIVIHTASATEQFGVSFEYYERINVSATRYIAEACKTHEVEKLIYVSTANTIAPGSRKDPGTELNGFSLYKAGSGYINSKYLAQQFVLEQVTQHQLPAVVVNPTFMIGPEDGKPSSGQLVLFGLNKRVLFYPSGGKNFVHIRDVGQGVINAIDKGTVGNCYLLAGENMTYREFFRTLNLISGQRPLMVRIPTSVLKLAGVLGSLLQRMTGRTAKLNRSTAYMLCLDNYYSGMKSERHLGLEYQPAITAIGEAYQWFKDNKYA